MALGPGTRLGPYEILAPLGAGGMGEVYRARDTRLGRDVAIKVLPEGFARDPDRVSRFEREARTVAVLNHPNIVVLYTIEEADGIRFLTMELVEGQSLDHLLLGGGLPIPRLLDIGIALADALAAAHDKGVVHRDLKPGNVMLTGEGRVKVLDFGLAKLSGPDSDPSATQAATMASPLSTSGQVMGTAPYMAPEQIRGEPVDARTDLFALGVVLYELAAGRRPFAGATAADVTSASCGTRRHRSSACARSCRGAWSGSSAAAWRRARAIVTRRHSTSAMNSAGRSRRSRQGVARAAADSRRSWWLECWP